MNFSQRYGYTPVRDAIQVESMDDPLRNTLWSLLQLLIWGRVRYSDVTYGYYLNGSGNDAIRLLCRRLWYNYFKRPIDQLDKLA
jgi:hypothetical protein